MRQRVRIRADADDMWQTVRPGTFSEKQTQWLTLQLCLLTVGVTERIESSRIDHLFKQVTGENWPQVSLRSPSGAKLETR